MMKDGIVSYFLIIDNEAALIDYIAADLDCDKRKINCKYITSRIQSKYSYSHNENRIYNHRLYEINISHFPERINTTISLLMEGITTGLVFPIWKKMRTS